jgi:hypothetical protein
MDMKLGFYASVLHFVVPSMIKSFCGHVAIFLDLQTFNPIENVNILSFVVYGFPQVCFF